MKSIIEFFNGEKISVPDIGVLDIGAMLIGNQRKEYQSLIDADIARVIGFEPVENECEKLNIRYQNDKITFLPYFIGDGKKQTFCLNNHPMTSSLYESNSELLNLFQNLSNLTVTVNREEVQTTRLDDISKLEFPIDYIKIDIQGAELQAFEGGINVLENTTVIQTEVEWLPLYKNQPLFSEVELFLRGQGLVLHRILNFGTRAFKPFIFKNNANIGPQQLWSDAVFIRDFTKLYKLSDRQLSVYAILMHEIYKSIDLTAHVLSILGERIGREIDNNYRLFIS